MKNISMASEKFCLKWNDFESNISVAFRELREDKDFFDVTIACDDEQISAHKVIVGQDRRMSVLRDLVDLRTVGSYMYMYSSCTVHRVREQDCRLSPVRSVQSGECVWPS